jgi:hypothetical protein
MDLRKFYRKIREVQATISDEFVYIASIETADGGRNGVVNEVNRELAARLIVEGKAALASPDQIETFHSTNAETRKRLEKTEIAKKIQVAIISEPEERPVARKPVVK